MLFEEKLGKLNQAQRKAVEAIDGPVMVIAGPGTGKTEILSLRIGNIRLHADTDFSNILCLTFTEAAAAEMRQRLILYFGPEAYKIQVSTFHSFCNLVIQENPFAFQQARELEPISEIERFRLLQQLIDHFDPEHPLKKFKGQVYFEWRRLNDLFMTMKKEHWSPEFMLERIDEYTERMRQDVKYTYQRKSGENNKGDFNSNKFKKEVSDKMDTLRAAVGEYEHFNHLMAEQGKYDFEDMLLWVYDAFDKNADLLADYQERFQYILVDEFQDTNGIQLDILRKLIEHEWVDRPNVFVVGDDDQAIYRFQGANVENLLSFYHHYQPDVILLQENYRSSQTIIDAARVLMRPVSASAIQQSYAAEKIIVGAGKYAGHDKPVHVYAYPTLTYENADIFHQVRRWYEEKTEGTLAVLYPKHALGSDLAQALKGAGIPYHMARSGDVLQHPLITNLLDILNCIHQLSAGADNDDAQLYRVLHLEYLDPKPYDLQKLILAYTASEREQRVSLYNWLCDPEKLNQISFIDKAWILHVADVLTKSITTYHTMTLMGFVEWVMHHFGLMDWVLRQKEKFHHLYAMKSFLTFIDQEAAGRRSFTIADLLDICHMMDTYKISLPMQSLAPPPKGIVLSTLHGAKGLEFEKVIIKNSTEGEWEKKRGNNQSFSMPDNLVRSTNESALAASETDIQDQDLRRLLYVGMTRAKYDLSLTFPLKKDDGGDLVRSKYVSELIASEDHVSLQTPTVDENLQAEYLVALMSGDQSTSVLLDQTEIQERVRNYVMNVSAINKYMECQVAFFYENILRIPAGEKAHMMFGSGLHWALQYLFKKRYEDGDLAAGKDYMLRMYEIYMENHRHRFTDKEYDDFMTYGQKVLGQYYDAYQHLWSDQVKYKTEFRIRDTHIAGVPVTGFIDRIDELDGQIMVYDYKTGKPENIIAKMKAPDASAPEGGDYWRQMVFYDLLLQQDPRIRKRMTAGFVHALEPKKDGTFVERNIVVTDADREIVTQQIVTTWQKIQALEFNKGCGECDWCKMHGIVATPDDQDENE
jgi:DNA helicase-2/ATP-dependent DNA helicase PcrA